MLPIEGVVFVLRARWLFQLVLDPFDLALCLMAAILFARRLRRTADRPVQPGRLRGAFDRRHPRFIFRRPTPADCALFGYGAAMHGVAREAPIVLDHVALLVVRKFAVHAFGFAPGHATPPVGKLLLSF